MSLRDKLGLSGKGKTPGLKAAAQKGKPPAPAAPQPPATAKKKGVRPPPPPYTSYETIKVACGHEIPFGIWQPDSKDKWRDQRRQNHIKKICPACRQALQDKEMAEARERRRLKKIAKNVWKGEASAHLERLPHGTHFSNLIYDGEKVQWTGSLHIPTETTIDNPDPAYQTFGPAAHSQLFKLLAELDQMYRTWKNPPTEEKKDDLPGGADGGGTEMG